MSQETSGLIAQVMPVFLLVLVAKGSAFLNMVKSIDRPYRRSDPDGSRRAHQVTFVIVALVLLGELVAVIGGGRSDGLNHFWGALVWTSFGVVLFYSLYELSGGDGPSPPQE
ncbi:hypothetical protein [Geodermatophilus sp. SYSU D01176]